VIVGSFAENGEHRALVSPTAQLRDLGSGATVGHGHNSAP
jgi:hypothetical protein